MGASPDAPPHTGGLLPPQWYERSATQLQHFNHNNNRNNLNHQ